VEKNQNNYFISIKPAFTAIFLLLLFKTAAQKMKTYGENCGSFYVSMDHLRKLKQHEIDFYDFRPGQKVASIGAQCCHWEAAFASVTDSVSFYLEDIDTSKFKQSQADFVWNYYGQLRGRKMTSTYQLILGDEKSTKLPENTFDKILIINSFHEFTYQVEMLEDIKKKLKTGGILYIDEALPKRKGQLHGICNLPMLNAQEMVSFFVKNGFEYVEGLEFNYRQKVPVRKIFAFRIK
jgi:ubiquinone/menaquinone biosynthesis C-methylase UbiE